MQKTSFLAHLGKNLPEKLSGLSVKGGGVPPFPPRFFWQNDIPLRSKNDVSVLNKVKNGPKRPYNGPKNA